MRDEPKLILLDTHIWLWLMSGAVKAVSPKLRALVDKLAPESRVRISAISTWEIGILISKNRISLGENPQEYVYRAIRDLNIGAEAITAEIAMDSAFLPEGLHGDPADRILIATAKHIDATLITHDKEILAYSKKHGLPAMSL